MGGCWDVTGITSLDTSAYNRFMAANGQPKTFMSEHNGNGHHAPEKPPLIVSTRAQVNQRIAECMVLALKGKTTGAIKVHLHDKYGVKWRQATRYLARAREAVRQTLE